MKIGGAVRNLPKEVRTFSHTSRAKKVVALAALSSSEHDSIEMCNRDLKTSIQTPTNTRISIVISGWLNACARFNCYIAETC